MFNQILLLIYRFFLHEGGRRLNWMEQYLDYDDKAALSSDDIKNERSAYETIFSEKYWSELERLYLDLLNKMDGIPYSHCEDALEVLAFIQEISATALWKYHQSVGMVIEEFVKDFDRLDVPNERVRLYEKAQKHCTK